MKNMLWLCTLLFISACTSVTPQLRYNTANEMLMMAPEPYPQERPVNVTMASPIAAGAAGVPTMEIIVRDFLYPKDNLDADVTNVIFFPRRPVTKSDKDQYVFICEVWKNSYPSIKEIRDSMSSKDNVKLIPFYWPLRQQVKTEDCSELVDKYDYARMQLFAVKNKITTTKLLMICRLKSGTITMNVSSIKTEEDLVMAMDTWRKRMCREPEDHTVVYAYNLAYAAKKVLGALGSLLTLKLKT